MSSCSRSVDTNIATPHMKEINTLRQQTTTHDITDISTKILCMSAINKSIHNTTITKLFTYIYTVCTPPIFNTSSLTYVTIHWNIHINRELGLIQISTSVRGTLCISEVVFTAADGIWVR